MDFLLSLDFCTEDAKTQFLNKSRKGWKLNHHTSNFYKILKTSLSLGDIENKIKNEMKPGDHYWISDRHKNINHNYEKETESDRIVMMWQGYFDMDKNFDNS